MRSKEQRTARDTARTRLRALTSAPPLDPPSARIRSSPSPPGPPPSFGRTALASDVPWEGPAYETWEAVPFAGGPPGRSPALWTARAESDPPPEPWPEGFGYPERSRLSRPEFEELPEPAGREGFGERPEGFEERTEPTTPWLEEFHDAAAASRWSRPEHVGETEEPPMRTRLEELSAAGRTRLGLLTPRLDPGTPGLRVLVVLGIVAAAVAGVLAWRSRPVAEPIAPPVPVSGALSAAVSRGAGGGATGGAGGSGAGGTSVPGNAAASGSGAETLPSPATTSVVIVYVTGKVRRPGVLSLPAGSRVVDAIKAAGGVRRGADPGGVNLARRLVDGEQIVVGAPAAQAGGSGQGPQPLPGTDGTPVNLNTATVEQLNTLPGVGDVLAQRIVEFRTAHGGFQSVDQLQQVSGIGERKFAELRDKVAV
ncbi:hypothetical protein GCM10009530_01270 [Microbispora corallina]|uniref:Helix-hairpin-helix DNA-binding motif class 1 domain-containing protein n=1 Tax=Microbispora corallina TaxID=83302 RepID=A0ABQ4FS54_9ACTN|nr:ComEA family DNA-binding protein [Microbispora corallina]GIH37646.1 hypothetical protein Mco01_06460 [Microbispora corallina]